jgi:pyruvate/2-oxoglutarate dehydrogenase complex dihydrolipoamide dehydrogenase (E3) component
MERQVAKSAIDVRLSTRVTPEYARAQGADVIIAAVGAAPVTPAISGIENALGATQAYKNPGSVGERAVILGGGLVGTELGIYLSMLGKSVTVVEMTDHISHGGNFLHIKAIDNEIRRHNVNMRFLTRAVALDGSSVICEDVTTGERVTIDADTVICAAGTTALSDTAKEFYDCAPQFHFIGDCRAAQNLMAATGNAFHVARDIGRFA